MSRISESGRDLQTKIRGLNRQAKWFILHGDTREENVGISFFKAFRQLEAQLLALIDSAKQAERLAQEAKNHFELFFNMSPDAIMISRFQDGAIVECNEAFLALSGYRLEEVLNPAFSTANLYAHAYDKMKILSLLQEKGVCSNMEAVFRKRDGEVRTGLFSAKVIMLGEVKHVISITRDITERKQVEEELRKSEARYRMLAENIKDVIWTLNTETLRFTYISPSVFQLRGYTPEEVMAQSLEEVLTPEVADDIREKIRAGAVAYLAGRQLSDQDEVLEAAQPCKNGSVVWTESVTRYYTNQDSGVVEMRGVTRDISERKAKEAEILFLSYHDQLTELYNRRFYEEELKRLDIERNLPISLVMADVNGLKMTNDAFGHAAGDELLKAIARIIKGACRFDDIVARIGGDEFILLLPRTDSNAAGNIVRRIKRVVGACKVGNTIPSVSFGWSVKTSAHESMARVYMQADDHMYRNKLSESSSMKSETIRLITKTIFEKNGREEAHAKRVSLLCAQLALDLGLSAEDGAELKTAGLMHDIGKIGVKEGVLVKTDNLTHLEWQEIRRHPETGYHILSAVHEFAEIAKVILAHHENWDGSGYPKGLKGENIPLKARILAIAEAYDAMTNDTVYKGKIDAAAAVQELQKQAGKQFDPALVQVFVEKTLTTMNNNGEGGNTCNGI